MQRKLKVIKLSESDETALIEIISKTFFKAPQLPGLIKKPQHTEKMIKNLVDLYKKTGKVQMFGIKKDEKLVCVGFCIDSDSKPGFFKLIKFGYLTIILLGLKGLKELYICDKNKPKYDKTCLELMFFGTLNSYQKKGLGKLMLNYLYECAKKNNYGGVTGVTNSIRPALKFYIKDGWIIDKEFNIENYKFCWVRQIV